VYGSYLARFALWEALCGMGKLGMAFQEFSLGIKDDDIPKMTAMS
jgi:hypothetical protein